MTGKHLRMPSKKLATRVVLPLLMAAVVAGIWLAKNPRTQDPATVDATPPTVDATRPNSDVAVDETSPAVNPDFALHVTEALDLEGLKSYGLPIMIDFGADSCIPCKEMAPVLVKLNKQLQGKAIIRFVDVWKYQKLAQGYPISVIPTQVFFDKAGKPFVPSDPQGMQMNMYSSRDTNEHVFTTHEGGMTEEMILVALTEMGVGK